MVSAGIEPKPLVLQVQSWTIMTKNDILVTHNGIMFFILMAASTQLMDHTVF